LRGSYARGFRAPNLEQSNATGIRRVNGGREDWILCEATARANGTPFNTGDCDGTSVQSVRASGPDLGPESNQNFSLGGVFQPPSTNLTFTVDYWKIKQKDVVGIFAYQNQLSLDYLLRLQGSSNPNVIRDTPDAGTAALFSAAGLARYISGVIDTSVTSSLDMRSNVPSATSLIKKHQKTTFMAVLVYPRLPMKLAIRQSAA